MKITITQDGKIFNGNTCIGFIEDEIVYLFVRGSSVKIGTFDHRSEVTVMVEKYFNDRQNS